MKGYPSSIYRIQLSEGFSFRRATKLIPYLKELGVEGVYCSPYFAAYSSHGYDITDYNQINPKLGSKKDFENFCKTLKEHKLYHYADFVPNHMGVKGENAWWIDVLRKGKQSPYATFFDIDWSQEKILVPLLGESLDEALKKGKLKKKGKWMYYGDQKFPIEGIEHYRLVDWLYAAQETSYRRFFNINELIGVRVEDPKVFAEVHPLLFQLINEKKIDGLRIDHPDGLYDPKGYFDRLRAHCDIPIFVEKILGFEEELPASWPVAGTVGYEYCNRLTGLFVCPAQQLDTVYQDFVGPILPFEDLLYEQKKFFMATEMAGDVRQLCERLFAFTSKMRSTLDIPKGDLIKAVFELLAHFPVYRTYIRPKGKVSSRDGAYLEKAFKKARHSNRELGHRVFDLLEDIFFLKIDTPYLRDFILRFQQLSAPIMAKGFEDITLYQFNRMLALNEVGGAPERGGVSIEEFHAYNQDKQKKHPFGILSSSTHDTKRSLDTRMQIAAFSEIPDQWALALSTWSKMNASFKTQLPEVLAPEPNMEIYLYQTLIGVWPSRPSFERLWTVFQKSIREARTHTSWRHPDPAYEDACKNFLKAILDAKTRFFRSFTAFQKKIQEAGELKSLAATALKLGGPGIVDVYEGCDTFRYTLVDPDNRRPVDYGEKPTEKTRLHLIALEDRKKHKKLFLEGKYIPIKITGPQKENVIAYMRADDKRARLIAAVLFPLKYIPDETTTLQLPKKWGRGKDLFTQRTVQAGKIPLSDLFLDHPFAWITW